jgi:hypothetical protein
MRLLLSGWYRLTGWYRLMIAGADYPGTLVSAAET